MDLCITESYRKAFGFDPLFPLRIVACSHFCSIEPGVSDRAEKLLSVLKNQAENTLCMWFILNFVNLIWVFPLWDREIREDSQLISSWAKQNWCFNHLPPHSRFVIHSTFRQILTRQGLHSPGAQYMADGCYTQSSGCLSSTRVSFMSCSSRTWPGDCQSKVD